MKMINFSVITHLLAAAGGAVVGGFIGHAIGKKKGRDQLNGYEIKTDDLKSFQQVHNKALKEVLDYALESASGIRDDHQAWADDMYNILHFRDSGDREVGGFRVPQTRSHNFNRCPHTLISEETKRHLDDLNLLFMGYFKRKSTKRGLLKKPLRAVSDHSGTENGIEWDLDLNVSDKAILQWNTIYHLIMETMNYIISLAQIAAREQSVGDAQDGAPSTLSIDDCATSIQEAYNVLRRLLLGAHYHLSGRRKTAISQFFMGDTGRQKWVSALLGSDLLWRCVRSVVNDAKRCVHIVHAAELQASQERLIRSANQNLALLAKHPFKINEYIRPSQRFLLPRLSGAVLNDNGHELAEDIKAHQLLLVHLAGKNEVQNPVVIPPSAEHAIKSSQESGWEFVHAFAIGMDVRQTLRAVNGIVYDQFVRQGRPGSNPNERALLEQGSALADLSMLLAIGSARSERFSTLVRQAKKSNMLISDNLTSSDQPFGLLCEALNVARHVGFPKEKKLFSKDMLIMLQAARDQVAIQCDVASYVEKSVASVRVFLSTLLSKAEYDVICKVALCHLRASTAIERILFSIRNNDKELHCLLNHSEKKPLLSQLTRDVIKSLANLEREYPGLERHPFGFAYAQVLTRKSMRCALWQEIVTKLNALLNALDNTNAPSMLSLKDLLCQYCGIESLADMESSGLMVQIAVCNFLVEKINHSLEVDKTKEIVAIINGIHSAALTPPKELYEGIIEAAYVCIEQVDFFVRTLQDALREGVITQGFFDQIAQPLRPFYRKTHHHGYRFDVSALCDFSALHDFVDGHLQNSFAVIQQKVEWLENKEQRSKSEEKLLMWLQEDLLKSFDPKALFLRLDPYKIECFIGLQKGFIQTQLQKYQKISEQQQLIMRKQVEDMRMAHAQFEEESVSIKQTLEARLQDVNAQLKALTANHDQLSKHSANLHSYAKDILEKYEALNQEKQNLIQDQLGAIENQVGQWQAQAKQIATWQGKQEDEMFADLESWLADISKMEQAYVVHRKEKIIKGLFDDRHASHYVTVLDNWASNHAGVFDGAVDVATRRKAITEHMLKAKVEQRFGAQRQYVHTYFKLRKQTMKDECQTNIKHCKEQAATLGLALENFKARNAALEEKSKNLSNLLETHVKGLERLEKNLQLLESRFTVIVEKITSSLDQIKSEIETLYDEQYKLHQKVAENEEKVSVLIANDVLGEWPLNRLLEKDIVSSHLDVLSNLGPLNQHVAKNWSALVPYQEKGVMRLLPNQHLSRFLDQVAKFFLSISIADLGKERVSDEIFQEIASLLQRDYRDVVGALIRAIRDDANHLLDGTLPSGVPEAIGLRVNEHVSDLRKILLKSHLPSFDNVALVLKGWSFLRVIDRVPKLSGLLIESRLFGAVESQQSQDMVVVSQEGANQVSHLIEFVCRNQHVVEKAMRKFVAEVVKIKKVKKLKQIIIENALIACQEPQYDRTQSMHVARQKAVGALISFTQDVLLPKLARSAPRLGSIMFLPDFFTRVTDNSASQVSTERAWLLILEQLPFPFLRYEIFSYLLKMPSPCGGVLRSFLEKTVGGLHAFFGREKPEHFDALLDACYAYLKTARPNIEDVRGQWQLGFSRGKNVVLFRENSFYWSLLHQLIIATNLPAQSVLYAVMAKANKLTSGAHTLLKALQKVVLDRLEPALKTHLSSPEKKDAFFRHEVLRSHQNLKEAPSHTLIHKLVVFLREQITLHADTNTFLKALRLKCASHLIKINVFSRGSDGRWLWHQHSTSAEASVVPANQVDADVHLVDMDDRYASVLEGGYLPSKVLMAEQSWALTLRHTVSMEGRYQADIRFAQENRDVNNQQDGEALPSYPSLPVRNCTIQ